MKLTDWCIVFAAVFLCLMLPVRLRENYMAQSFLKQKEYNRMLDRACEDSLTDSVMRENDDGSIVVDEARVHARFGELLALGFDTVSAGQREYLRECIRMEQFHNLNRSLTVEQTEQLRGLFERAVIQAHSGRVQEDARMFSFYFPFVPGEDWYQNLAGPSMYSLFEADSRKDPWKKYRRYVFSGGRIVKQAAEVQSEAAQSGFY